MKISFIGDIALNGLFVKEKKLNVDRFFTISRILQKVDINFANLETPIQIIGNENPLIKGKNHYFLGTDKDVLVEVFQMLNISCVSLANNHIFDYSDEGIEETIKCLNELGIKWNGIRLKGDKIACTYFQKDKLKIGFLAYVDLSTNPKITSNIKYDLNVLDINSSTHDIKRAKNECDLLIVSLHWGKDYSNFFTKNQRIIAHKLLQAGADVIMGHHPHVVQGYEKFDKSHIFYSLGNFCFGDYYRGKSLKSSNIKTKKSYLSVLDLKNNSIEFFPFYEKRGNFNELKTEVPYKNFYRITLIKNQYLIINAIILIKEAFFDRVFDFTFGYYRNPYKELLNFNNLKKIKYFKDDLRNLLKSE